MASLALFLSVGCGSGAKDPTQPGSGTPDDNNSSKTNNNNNTTNNNNNNNSTGGACNAGQQKCDGMNLSYCQDGKWATSTCDHLCQQAGLGAATGCMHDNQKGYETCFCKSSSGSTCKDGEQKCSGMTLSVCQNGAWSTSGCEFLCQQAGYGLAQSCGFDSQKGKEICFCADPPTTCQNGAQKCSGLNLSTCKNSGWQTQSCTDLCHAAGLGRAQSCGFDSQKGLDTCFCFDGVIGDPCLSDTDCKDGVCNAAGWCAKACNHDFDCGKNSLKQQNHCMETQAGGGVCFPWCTTNAQCASFPGTVCQQQVINKDGVTVDGVCATP
jgi:hypothetical protein